MRFILVPVVGNMLESRDIGFRKDIKMGIVDIRSVGIHQTAYFGEFGIIFYLGWNPFIVSPVLVLPYIEVHFLERRRVSTGNLLVHEKHFVLVSGIVS